MTINSTAKFFQENNLIRRTDLAELKGARLAIDAQNWVKLLQFNEPYHMAMGGIPLSLETVVDEEIEKLTRYDITPLFVFDGIKLPPPPQMNPDSKPLNSGVQTQGLEQYRSREEAWRLYQKNDYPAAKREFREAGSGVNSTGFIEGVIKCFRKRNIEFFRAPYLAWAQCAWFCGQKDRVASAVWGSEEILLFIGLVQYDKLILRLDFDKGIFEWVSLSEICDALGAQNNPQGQGVSVSQFIDCCILVGFRGGWIQGMSYTIDDSVVESLRDGISSSLGGIMQTGPHSLPATHFAQAFQDIAVVARDLIQFRSGPSLLEYKVRTFNLDTMYLDQVLEQFLRIKNLVLHHIILNMDCVGIPISMHNNTHPEKDRNYYGNSMMTMPQKNVINNIVPNNLHTIIGPRLPNLVYFILSIGLVSPQVIYNVVHNIMMDFLPTIDSYEYRDLLQKIVPLRTQIAYLLINPMVRKDEVYWKVVPHGGRRPVMSYIQWHTEKTIALHTPPELLLDDWDVTWKADIAASFPKDEKGQLVMNFCTVLQFAKCALKAAIPINVYGPPKQYNQFEEVVCVILLKSLDLLGYFTHPPQQKPLGSDESGTSLFAEALLDVHWWYAEQGVLFIELIRTGALNCQPFKPPYSNPSEMVTITLMTDPNVLLISRVLSIVPMNLKAEDWGSNIVVRDLCAFHVLFKSLYKTLRNLCEIIMMVMFMDNRVRPANMPMDSVTLFNELVQRLPFSDNTNTAMGIVVYYLLLRQHNAQGNTPQERWQTLQMEKIFPCCKDIRGDLSRAYGFWHEAIRVVVKLEKGSAMAGPLYQQFVDADRLLCNTMAAFSIPPFPRFPANPNPI
mmetsp:Transcript_48798/g.86922  ORF Transcript_48798/g.86922 Transcript_48798/m.86922 type:complete len:843 (-) Transcript_48798:1336-3864(-)